jgi:hypothetical protein
MAGGKGKSIGGKAAPGKDAAGKTQKSHSAKAGLQVSLLVILMLLGFQNILLHYLRLLLRWYCYATWIR